MARDADRASVPAFLDVRCLCGKVHTLLRDKVLDGLSKSRWKCGGCKRRFVVACTPADETHPETFWPVFLDQVPSTGSTVDEGSTEEGAGSRKVADEIHFKCRCGCRLVGRSRTVDRLMRCPKCASRIVLRLGYERGTEDPTPVLEYPDDLADRQEAQDRPGRTS